MCGEHYRASDSRSLGLTVHPHVCGEHMSIVIGHLTLSGSSPRVWGTHLHTIQLPYRWSPVHPHVCGEHGFIIRCIRKVIGSSPRVWGTHKLGRIAGLRSRFIPTCVGNTRQSVAGALVRPVHPHVCGEHSGPSLRRTCTCGSSPRVWGTLEKLFSISVGHRFIPTCVGNTPVFPFLPRQNPVHPHVCGEHIIRMIMIAAVNGSSPRVWGTLTLLVYCVSLYRFIPTCVGNTFSEYHCVDSYTVHPHVCGEHRCACFPINVVCGSSPRVWGTYRNRN